MADTDKLKKLIENGVHFGHQIQRRDPRMDPFIWGKKNGVHLIDVSKTVHQLERAAQFLEAVASEGKQILFVGTKRPAQGIIEETAKKLNCPFSATRWVGGTLSNYPQVRKSVTKLLHYEDVVSKSDKSN
ncbi:MAG: 30S ribosomal protein S2, partial [Pseudomonadota bacterium]